MVINYAYTSFVNSSYGNWIGLIRARDNESEYRQMIRAGINANVQGTNDVA